MQVLRAVPAKFPVAVAPVEAEVMAGMGHKPLYFVAARVLHHVVCC